MKMTMATVGGWCAPFDPEKACEDEAEGCRCSRCAAIALALRHMQKYGSPANRPFDWVPGVRPPPGRRLLDPRDSAG